MSQKLIPIYNPSVNGRRYITEKSARRAIARGCAKLIDGKVAFRSAVLVDAVTLQREEPDKDSAHIYVADRWSYPHTQWYIDRASEHQ